MQIKFLQKKNQCWCQLEQLGMSVHFLIIIKTNLLMGLFVPESLK